MPLAADVETLRQRRLEPGAETLRHPLAPPVVHRHQDLDPVEAEGVERVGHGQARCAGREAASGVGRSDPVAELDAAVGEVGVLEPAAADDVAGRIDDHERAPTRDARVDHPLERTLR